MDIRTLKYFLIVAREKNITRAAEMLHMTQPPLSRQMKELEQEIGKPLFVRHKRALELTDEGKLLRQRAAQIVGLMEKTEKELQEMNEIAGNVRIGCAETEGIAPIVILLSSIRSRYPAIHYKLYSGDSDRILARLDAGLIDFGFIAGEADLQHYEYRRLHKGSCWGIYVPSGHPLAGRSSATPEDLQKMPLILSRQTTNNSSFFAWIGMEREELDIVMTYDLIYNASLFALQGAGVLVGIEKLLDRPGLCFVPLAPAIEAPIWLVWKKGQLFSKAADMVLDSIKKDTEVS